MAAKAPCDEGGAKTVEAPETRKYKAAGHHHLVSVFTEYLTMEEDLGHM